jgi:DNA-binding Lrp family transcriptional regulator
VKKKELRMITAIVMINCEVGKVHSVSDALVRLDGVAEVYSISGEYDILAIIRVKEYDSLANVVSEEISRVNGITRTNTHMAFRCYAKQDMEKMWSSYLEP